MGGSAAVKGQPCSLCSQPEQAHDDAACPMGHTPALPPLPFKLIVCGSRDWPERERATIRAWLARFPPRTVVIHGDCPTGADKIAGEVARELGFTVRAYPADWSTHGRAAGPIRNAAMLAAEHREGAIVDRCLAFTAALQRGDRLTGTGDMVARAVAAGVVVTVVPPGCRP